MQRVYIGYIRTCVCPCGMAYAIQILYIYRIVSAAPSRAWRALRKGGRRRRADGEAEEGGNELLAALAKFVANSQNIYMHIYILDPALRI